MKKIDRLNFLKISETLYAAFLAAGLLISADCYFKLLWPSALLLLSAFAFQSLLVWSEERGLRIPVWGGIALLVLLLACYWWRSGKNMNTFYFFLGIECACLAASFLCYLAAGRLWLKTLVFLFQFLFLVLSGIQELSMPLWGICIILFCFLLLLTELAEYRLKASGKNALYLFPVFLISVLLLLCFPVKNTPIQWNGIKNLAGAVQEKWYSLIVAADYMLSGKNSSYGLAFTGYQPDSELGGTILSSERAQISVEGLQTKSPLYLAGSIKNIYTGQGWKAEEGEKPYEEEEFLIQCREWDAALERCVFTEEEKRELVRFTSCSINYEGVKTESLFLPLLTKSLVLPEKAELAKKREASPSLSKAKGVGFSYHINFLEVNYLDERIARLFRQQAWGSAPQNDTFWKERRDYIYEQYTKLPECLPQRVYDLAAEITKGAQNDYDRLKAIEAYLRGLTYTTAPEVCPEERDFTDYFLFDSGAGYCTYFATAMAVLGRCEGIPTRYAEGFLTKDTCRPGLQKHELSSKSAHAWAEAYLDGIGWVPFEATPGYREAVDQVWAQPQTGDSLSPLQIPAGEKDESDSLEEEAALDRISDFSESGKQLLLYFLWSALVILFFAAVSGLAFLFRIKYRRKHYLSLTAGKKLEFQMKKIFLFGKLYGYLLEGGETLSAYAQRLAGVLNTEEASLAEICRLYQSVRFGEGTELEKTVQKAERYTKCLEKQYLEGCGHLKKLFYYIR